MTLPNLVWIVGFGASNTSILTEYLFAKGFIDAGDHTVNDIYIHIFENYLQPQKLSFHYKSIWCIYLYDDIEDALQFIKSSQTQLQVYNKLMRYEYESVSDDEFSKVFLEYYRVWDMIDESLLNFPIMKIHNKHFRSAIPKLETFLRSNCSALSSMIEPAYLNISSKQIFEILNVVKIKDVEIPYNKDDKVIWFSSFGGCGTTFLMFYATQKPNYKIFPRKHCLSPFRVDYNGEVASFKAVYIYGDPIACLKSLIRRGFEHSLNRFFAIDYNRDTYNHDKHLSLMYSNFKEWTKPSPLLNFDIAYVKYEKMYSNIHAICDFLEIDASDFPKEKERTSTHIQIHDEQILRTKYANFIQEVENQPDFYISRATA